MMNYISMTRLAATITSALGVDAPEKADKPISHVERLVEDKLNGRADRVFIYNPDALGMWMYQKYPEDFMNVTAKTQLALPVATVMPSVTPVCFGTMYTGALPEIHGIREYAKPVIKIDSLFDALVRAEKKVALVAVAESSMAMIFAERNIDYYLMPYDGEVTEKTLELIGKDKYDVIVAYHQEYDDMIHDTTPESPESIAAFHRHMEAFGKFTEAIEKTWRNYNTLICMATDHGTHVNEEGFGDHGDYVEEDINVMHFYGAYPKR